MSAEDAILYRKIGKNWCVLGYGFTFADVGISDEEFESRSNVVEFERLFETLELLSKEHETEHGICYAGEFVSDPPPEVPAEHRTLCCVPEQYRERP